MVTAPASRGLVLWMPTKGISDRHGLPIVRMSEGLLRFMPRQDCNQEIRLGIDSRDRCRGEMEGTPHIININH